MSGRLVLLHGFTGSPASWDEVADRLESGIDVFRPTLSGHDPDYVPDVDDAPASFGEEVFGIVADILASFGGAPMHLAGYSLGARIALTMITTAPDLFASATLIGLNPGLRTEAERTQRRAADARWIELLEDGIQPFVEEWEKLPLWASQERLPADVRADLRAARLRHDPRGLALSLRIAGLAEQPDLRPRLHAVQVPVTLMAGAEDPKFHAFALETASLLPHARVVVVPDAGHNLLLERPQAVADELNRMIR